MSPPGAAVGGLQAESGGEVTRHGRLGITKLRLQQGWSEFLTFCMIAQACR